MEIKLTELEPKVSSCLAGWGSATSYHKVQRCRKSLHRLAIGWSNRTFSQSEIHVNKHVYLHQSVSNYHLNMSCFYPSCSPLYPQTQPSHGASQPASPHLHPWTSSPACLLLSFSSPFSPCFLTQGRPPLPLSFSLSLFFLSPFFFSRQHTQSPSPSSSLPSQPPFQWMHNLPPSAVEGGGGGGGWSALGLRRGKEESSTHADTNSITKTHSPQPPLYVCVCVHICRGTQEHGVWQTGVGLGGVLMALSAGNGLLLHRQLQNQLSSQATSPYFICIGKTHTFTYSWAGSHPPPTNDYAKLQPTVKKKKSSHKGK